MRTRSSRFFVILLHLVGVSHPSWMCADTGIVAVLPCPLALERINLYHTATSVERKNHTRHQKRRIKESKPEDEPEKEQHNNVNSRRRRQKSTSTTFQAQSLVKTEVDATPMWLQDTSDGSCLGPSGTFSECGDATLWFVENHKLPLSNKLALLSGGFGRSASSGPSTGFVFRVVDQDYTALSNTMNVTAGASTASNTISDRTIRNYSITSVPHRRKGKKHTQEECLNAELKISSVVVQDCRRRGGFVWQAKAGSSVWVLSEEGIIRPANQKQLDESPLCLARADNSEAILSSCDLGSPVQFSFLRYRAVAIPHAMVIDGVSPMDESLRARAKNSDNSKSRRKSIDQTDISTISTLSVNRDRARSQATEPAMHPDLKISSALLFRHRHARKTSVSLSEPLEKNRFEILLNTNPILLAPRPASASEPRGRAFDALFDTNPILFAGGKRPKTPTSTSQHQHTIEDAASNAIRIKGHRFLNEAKDGIWTCPQTGMEYHTDLHTYLGWSREEHGRQTLTGFGIFRKGYVIKVYGIAFYVSKRDVLAESAFQRYASMTADQLRSRPDFYELLRSRERLFDRTILLKTNMQLSTETMRSSLGADWSYLTDEAKRLLVEFSTIPRDADDSMLRTIQSLENPSRCSCSQIAPPEYNASPECCARGTELVFTWTKSNQLEVRLNGRIMEVFDRPDIAEGIFYEYLRYDDPISPELRDSVVDGFPFLLSPLVHKRAFDMGKTASLKNAGVRTSFLPAIMNNMAEFLRLQIADMAESSKRGITELSEAADIAASVFRETAQDISKELDRRRNLIAMHAIGAPVFAMKLLGRDPETTEIFTKWLAGLHGHIVESEIPPLVVADDHLTRRSPHGRVFAYSISRWFGAEYHASDEIGPMKVHPNINKITVALVHLYLLLLFIVSFPGSYSTRTKCVVRRSFRSLKGFDPKYNEILPSKKHVDEAKMIQLFNSKSQRRYVTRNNITTRKGKSDDITDTSSALAPLKRKCLSYFL